MKKTILFFLLIITVKISAQMTEVKTERTTIGKTYSIMSKGDIELEKVDNSYYILAFNDKSYKTIKVPSAIVLKETDDTIESFYTSVLDGYDIPETKEKKFETSNYTITVKYLGNIPEKSIAILFQSKTKSKIEVTPFLSKYNWKELFGKNNK